MASEHGEKKMKKVRRKGEREIAELEAEIEDETKRLRRKLKAIRDEHEDTIEQKEADFQLQLRDLERQNAQELRKIERAHKDRIAVAK